MQYRVDGTNLKRFYPDFTEDDVYSQAVGGQTLSSTAGVTLVDETEVSGYLNASPTKPAITSSNASDSDSYVLHATSSDTITYTWQEGGSGSSSNIYFDNSLTNWSTVYVYFENSSNPSQNSGWGSHTMSPPGTGETYYKFDLSNISNDTNYSNYNIIVFSSGSGYQTANTSFSLPGGKLYTPNIKNDNYVYLHDNGYNSGSPNYNNQNITANFTPKGDVGNGNDWSK